MALVFVLEVPAKTPTGNFGRESKPVHQAARLMSADKEQRMRRFLPQVESARIQQILDSPDLILYTESEMPKAYQHWSGDLQGVHSPDYNISAVPGEPYGNGNVEFPWGTPAGMHRTAGTTSLRFLWLPRDEHGRRLPVVWYRKLHPGDSTPGYAWIFPVGAVVGEVLGLRGPDGHDYPFELRVRIRERGEWSVDIFRPYPRAADLSSRIKDLRPAWSGNTSLVRLVEHLDSNQRPPFRTLADRQPATRVFRQTMGVDTLPPAGDDQLVVELLTMQPFRSALGEYWRTYAEDTYVAAPTTDAPFHIVPANYDGAFLEVDRAACARCHETTGQRVDIFDPGRDWYGRIRGSDRIFSFHPFEPSSISHNGFGQPVAIRGALVDAGVLEAFDRSRHPNSVYHVLTETERGY
jgi:hypothetical protein